MESMTGLFSARAFSNASGPHENQSTGLWACWSKYGLVSWMRRLVCCPLMINLSALQSLCAFSEGSRLVADPMCVHKYGALFQRSLEGIIWVADGPVNIHVRRASCSKSD